MWRSYLASVPTTFLPSINCDPVQCNLLRTDWSRRGVLALGSVDAIAREAVAQLRRANQVGTIAAVEYRRIKARFEHRLVRLERKTGRTLLDAFDA
jgi:hypothetical protein